MAYTAYKLCDKINLSYYSYKLNLKNYPKICQNLEPTGYRDLNEFMSIKW